MRIWIRSDLHRSPHYHPSAITVLPEPEGGYDVVVLAGDVSHPPERVVYEAATEYRRPVVYVAGNHEFYKHDHGEELDLARQASSERDDVFFLENAEVRFGDVRILGCTLWTDYDLYGEAGRRKAMQSCRLGLNDHRAIRIDGRAFTPEDARALHMGSRAWLAERFAQPWEGRTVVVTHHAPSYRSVAAAYRGDPVTPGFATDLDAEILRWQPDLWVHGHVHNVSDYRIGKTRVVCSPTGYRWEQIENGHDSFLVVEV